jgi:hypothetical protein
MARQDVLDQITQTLGSVPGWLSGLPDPQLEHQWGLIAWLPAMLARWGLRRRWRY